ncbi:uncharacterized protein LOC119082468 [Bradysia coprophila]|uniref:uncharacterized protein LOC119082468 n=1 Tax=Bradysia coprophila TaxID=38358 RepID=UPI00187D8B85|nr:uncharacterized protein LOC119082468 [Bradysia coprophila]
MRFAKPEMKRGFVSYLRLICKKCNYLHVMKTCERRSDQFDLNYESVLGSMLIGIGFSQLEEFTGVLDIPYITSSSYRKKANKIYDDLSSAAEASTRLVAEAEIEFALKNGNVDTSGNPKVTGIVDAAWSKRSYRTNYSALSGSAGLIGHSTGKVLWQGVANKFCCVCKYISTNGKEHYDHECNINYVGPSTGMEPKLVVDGLKECEQKFGIRIHRLIGDGDSSVISEVLKSNIYQNPSLKTDKIECSNHVEQNTRGHLRKLGEKSPLKQYVTPGKIEKIIKAMRCARKHWNEQDIPIETKIENLRKDIYNAPFHVFGSHEKCNSYFCKKKDSKERNLLTVMKKDSTFNSILEAMSRVRSNARSYLLNENTNIAEQFNGLIVKYTGGKRVNFSKSKSFTGRSKLAVLQHWTGIFNSVRTYVQNSQPDTSKKLSP